jgi:hypothetical protein|nr:MAG TPA: hypothetical protein [Caudoviricetes sp.]
MAVLDRDNFFNRIRERLGEDDSEEALSYLEDMTDTWDDLERRASREGEENWEEKYNNLDAEWRKRYRDRFFSTIEGAKEDQEEDIKDDGKVRSFETLFEEREGE